MHSQPHHLLYYTLYCVLSHANRRASSLKKHKLVTPKTPSLGRHLGQTKTTGTVEIENFFRFGHLERIPPNPVNPIMPLAHSPKCLFLKPCRERIPPS